MSVKIDCKGLPCPQPVLKCKNAIESENPAKIKITVDNEAAKENVSRFMATKGYEVSVKEKDNLFVVKGKKNISAEPSAECEVCEVMSAEELSNVGSKTLVFLNSDVLGSGDDKLGAGLMFNFLSTLPELGDSLWRIIMVNGAVKLATEGSKCLEKLQDLEKAGVSILVCGTCLDHFDLLDKKKVGETTNMLDVVTSMQLASKVIKA
ncbi:sulfurtransferase-like selenium metabolism protein YedF [Maridesulfovibrio salexigens]|uniref:SirA family protein n=1 Tax=Maridesulfovibrio salexigens (strain ATCC 14822 / DSM 2638 / NCIMB 8403 / VKM B-1763) TaxID=526222 RepID=C6BUF2_MARSD|nr:sulfurtransferase-like selenium metabolism protein YedF [Maridesulfovibrio salexigens]ACS79961.1 SirA family protein [Maridesulfovibrio salexigens DSM 2638]